MKPRILLVAILSIFGSSAIAAPDSAQHAATPVVQLPPPPVEGIDTREVAKRVLPMSPEQIKDLRRMLDATQKAASEPPGTPPKPVTASLSASQSPGSTPPVVRIAPGFVSALVLLDATGAPWPISGFVNGNPTAFDVGMPDKTGNVITISSLSGYVHGNIAINLIGNTTPVVVTLVSGQKEIDYRADIRVLAKGPNASPMTGMESSSAMSDPMLLSALDGVTPPGATALSVSGGDAQAWRMGGRIYLRTRMPLLSPAWVSSTTSADGMRAYEIQESPVALVSNNGAPQTIRFSGF